MLTDDRSRARKLRQARVRRKLRGDATRPRLCVFRSKRHIYVQVISDATGETLLSASTMVRELRERVPKTSDVGAAKAVGEEIAKRCLAKGISTAVFDRNGFLYHGRVRAVAEGAREAGLRI